MSDEFEKRAVTSKMMRHLGMSEGAKERLDAENRRRTDWWGLCRRCGKRVEGTLDQLRAHTCHG